jgi:putative ABC transport system substrate-binding protein
MMRTSELGGPRAAGLPRYGPGAGITAPRSIVQVILIFVLLAAPLAAVAQPMGKQYRVGVLCGGPCTGPALEAMRQGLRERGYVEGQNITFEYRSAGGKYDTLPDLAADLVGLQVDVIVAGAGLPGALAAKRATTTIPVVFAGLGEDPVHYGLVQSMARPGGNVTGLVALYADLVAKQLELIRETVPGVSRVAALWDGGAEKALEPSFKSLDVASRALGVQPHLVAVRGTDDLVRAFRAAADTRAGALILLPSPAFFGDRVRMANLAAEHRLPAISPFIEFAEAGGLMAYGPNVTKMWGNAASIIDRILKGAKPAEIAVEQPTTFKLVINLKTAKAIGLTMPSTMLRRAHEVIE